METKTEVKKYEWPSAAVHCPHGLCASGHCPDCRVKSAVKNPFPSLLQSAEDERRAELNNASKKKFALNSKTLIS